jgi:hypothetical protein
MVVVVVVVDTHNAPFLHNNNNNNLATAVPTMHRIRTMVVDNNVVEDTTTGINIQINIYTDTTGDNNAIEVIERTTSSSMSMAAMAVVIMPVQVCIECRQVHIVVGLIQRLGLLEEIAAVVDSCIHNNKMTRKSIIGEVERMMIIIIILLLLLLLLVEIRVVEAIVGVEGAIAGVGAIVEMGDGVGGCARIAEKEMIEDPAGGVEETITIEMTIDTRPSREPRSRDLLADGIVTKII